MKGRAREVGLFTGDVAGFLVSIRSLIILAPQGDEGDCFVVCSLLFMLDAIDGPTEEDVTAKG